MPSMTWFRNHTGPGHVHHLAPSTLSAVDRIIARYVAGAIDATLLEIELDLELRPHTLVHSVRSGLYPRADVLTVIGARYGYEMLQSGMADANEIRILGEVL